MSPPGQTDQALEQALVFAVVGGHASLQQSYAARSQLGCKRVSTPNRTQAGGGFAQPGRWQQGVLRHHVQVFKCGGGKSWQCLVKKIYKKYDFIPRGIYEDGY